MMACHAKNSGVTNRRNNILREKSGNIRLLSEFYHCIKEEDSEISSLFWHKLYDHKNDTLPYIPIRKEELQKIDMRQGDTEQIALSAIIIAENLAYNAKRNN